MGSDPIDLNSYSALRLRNRPQHILHDPFGADALPLRRKVRQYPMTEHRRGDTPDVFRRNVQTAGEQGIRFRTKNQGLTGSRARAPVRR